MNYKAFISSKIVIALLAFFLLFLGNLKFQQWRSLQAIEKEKQSIAEQALRLERKNNELTQSLSYLNTTDFKERLARQQLNLKKEGEIVYSFTENATGSEIALNSPGQGSNFEKWIQFFFAK